MSQPEKYPRPRSAAEVESRWLLMALEGTRFYQENIEEIKKQLAAVAQQRRLHEIPDGIELPYWRCDGCGQVQGYKAADRWGGVENCGECRSTWKVLVYVDPNRRFKDWWLEPTSPLDSQTQSK